MKGTVFITSCDILRQERDSITLIPPSAYTGEANITLQAGHLLPKCYSRYLFARAKST